MYVIVDTRGDVVEGYTAAFRNEGIVAFGFGGEEFLEWFRAASTRDIEAVQCFLLGDFDARNACPEIVRQRSRGAIIALAEVRSLDTTLELFSAGIDDVVRKPVHVREIMARANAICRRTHANAQQARGRLKVYFDGRDPEVDGERISLPRRERRILEFLVSNAHRRVTKTQIFNAVYGIFEENVDEVVVEGHISKLRRKLRMLLGTDMIDAKRYLGYQFVGLDSTQTVGAAEDALAASAGAIARAVATQPAAHAFAE
jgi:DNA-binding response OmpR family regulator